MSEGSRTPPGLHSRSPQHARNPADNTQGAVEAPPDRKYLFLIFLRHGQSEANRKSRTRKSDRSSLATGGAVQETEEDVEGHLDDEDEAVIAALTKSMENTVPQKDATFLKDQGGELAEDVERVQASGGDVPEQKKTILRNLRDRLHNILKGAADAGTTATDTLKEKLPDELNKYLTDVSTSLEDFVKKCTGTVSKSFMTSDPNLTAEGLMQCITSGDALAHYLLMHHSIPLENIGWFSSPLSRAIQTGYTMISQVVRVEVGRRLSTGETIENKTVLHPPLQVSPFVNEILNAYDYQARFHTDNWPKKTLTSQVQTRLQWAFKLAEKNPITKQPNEPFRPAVVWNKKVLDEGSVAGASIKYDANILMHPNLFKFVRFYLPDIDYFVGKGSEEKTNVAMVVFCHGKLIRKAFPRIYDNVHDTMNTCGVQIKIPLDIWQNQVRDAFETTNGQLSDEDMKNDALIENQLVSSRGTGEYPSIEAFTYTFPKINYYPEVTMTCGQSEGKLYRPKPICYFGRPYTWLLKKENKVKLTEKVPEPPEPQSAPEPKDKVSRHDVQGAEELGFFEVDSANIPDNHVMKDITEIASDYVKTVRHQNTEDDADDVENKDVDVRPYSALQLMMRLYVEEEKKGQGVQGPHTKLLKIGYIFATETLPLLVYIFPAASYAVHTLISDWSDQPTDDTSDAVSRRQTFWKNMVLIAYYTIPLATWYTLLCIFRKQFVTYTLTLYQATALLTSTAIVAGVCAIVSKFNYNMSEKRNMAMLYDVIVLSYHFILFMVLWSCLAVFRASVVGRWFWFLVLVSVMIATFPKMDTHFFRPVCRALHKVKLGRRSTFQKVAFELGVAAFMTLELTWLVSSILNLPFIRAYENPRLYARNYMTKDRTPSSRWKEFWSTLSRGVASVSNSVVGLSRKRPLLLASYENVSAAPYVVLQDDILQAGGTEEGEESDTGAPTGGAAMTAT